MHKYAILGIFMPGFGRFVKNHAPLYLYRGNAVNTA